VGQSQWVRLMTDEGVVIGKLSVPPRPPRWFAQECLALKAGYNREKVTDADVMNDMSVADWLDTLFCNGRPIPLDLPLAPKQQEEFVLFRDDRWEVFSQDLKAIMQSQDKDAIQEFASKLDKHFESFGALTMEERHKVPPSEAHRWIPVPMSTFGIQGRQFTTWIPMVNVHGADRGVDPQTFLSPKKVFLWNFFDDDTRWENVANRSYAGKDAKAVLTAVESQIPPVRA